MILVVWGGLPSPDIVIGAEVFLYMIGSVFGAGQYLGVRNVVIALEKEILNLSINKITLKYSGLRYICIAFTGI